MWSREWVPYVFTSLSGIGIITNYSSFRYIRRTFNTKDNLFNILIKDSLLATLLACLQFVTDLILLLDFEFMRSKFGCILNQYGAYMGVMIGPVITLLISLRRYIQLRYTKLVKIDSKPLNMLTSVVMILAGVYSFVFSLVDTFGDLHQIRYMGLCLGNLNDWLMNEQVSETTDSIFQS